MFTAQWHWIVPADRLLLGCHIAGIKCRFWKKKALLGYFSSNICIFSNRNAWKTDENLKLAEQMQLLAVKGRFQLKFCA